MGYANATCPIEIPLLYLDAQVNAGAGMGFKLNGQTKLFIGSITSTSGYDIRLQIFDSLDLGTFNLIGRYDAGQSNILIDISNLSEFRIVVSGYNGDGYSKVYVNNIKIY